MHTFSETGTGVPAFLAKLWRLVEDPETNHLIYWNRDGRSFIIQNQAQFARELLPMNYKHNNMASFIRQLNMYGFHKITSIENGGLKFDRDEMEFSHPCFKRGYPYLLEHIKRKIATAKTIDDKASIKPEAVSKVLNEVKVMRGRQDSLDSRFSAMKQENEALWREIAMLRQKHMKQQQIVNKLIQFLVTIVQPTPRNMTGVKRNFHLMINDVPQSSKLRKRSKSNTGPIIHELTEELLDEVAQNEEEYDLIESSPHVMSPGTESRVDTNETGEEVPRPRSTHSVGSTFSDSTNIEDFLISNSKPNAASTSRTPDPEAEPVVYHITELPENVEYNEENLLGSDAAAVTHQVMVRQSNRRGRKRKHTESESSAELTNDGTKSKATQNNRDRTSGMNIKTETDIDPLSFLVEQGEIDQVHVDPELMGALTGAVERSNLASVSGRNNDKQIYTNQEEFISNEMPADLFEESPIVGDVNFESGAYNDTMNFSGNNNADRNDATGGPSSSSTSSTSKPANSTKKPELNRNLSLTKYSNDDILRFNTPREITMHLDTVQEDLETLKDLLRNDGYSLDANALLNNATTTGDRIVLHPSIDNLAQLFGDSDVLGPYGLALSDQQNADSSKKGNELMTYQQTYYPEDLSDMLNLETDSLPKDTGYSGGGGGKQNGTSSVLNTPLPERD